MVLHPCLILIYFTMVFNFTFSFNVPGLSNPFSRAPSTLPPTPTLVEPEPTPSRRPVLTSTPNPQDRTRKRGWEPSFSEPTRATSSPSPEAEWSSPPRLPVTNRPRKATKPPRAREREEESIVAGGWRRPLASSPPPSASWAAHGPVPCSHHFPHPQPFAQPQSWPYIIIRGCRCSLVSTVLCARTPHPRSTTCCLRCAACP
jgi:hypothetical protein